MSCSPGSEWWSIVRGSHEYYLTSIADSTKEYLRGESLSVIRELFDVDDWLYLGVIDDFIDFGWLSKKFDFRDPQGGCGLEPPEGFGIESFILLFGSWSHVEEEQLIQVLFDVK